MTNFFIDDTFELKFKLNVTGTSLKPSKVYVTLGSDISVRFTAEQVESDMWRAFITPVSDVIKPGSVQMCIDVLLNDRLHTVIRKEIIVQNAPSVTASVVDTTATIDPVSVEATPSLPVAVLPEPEVVQPIVDTQDEEPKLVDLTKSTDEDIAPIAVKPLITEIVEPKPEPKQKTVVRAKIPSVKYEPKKIELDFKSIIAEANVNEPVASPENVKTPVKITEIQTQKTPFTLKKGKIITK